MPSRWIWLICVGVAWHTPSAAAQPLTFDTTSYAAATGARGAVAADFNRDGWTDVATANTGRNTIAIMMSRGSEGGFFPPREVAVGAGPFDIAAGDLDRDGIPDLVVTTPDAGTIDVLLIGRGGDVTSHRVSTAGESRGVTLADVTHDGVLDLIYSDYARSVVVMLRGDGSGAFPVKAGEVAVFSRPQGVAAADFNHDGLMDVAVASTNGTALNVLYGGASGTFTRKTIDAGRTLNVLALADVNADGWMDIATAATSTNLVVMFCGSATGFTLAGTRATGSSPRSIASGDFNHDGRPDFAVANRGANTVTVLLGRKDGSVVPDAWGDLPAAAGARGIASADFDNDGRADIAAGSEFAAQLSLFENSTAFVPPAFSLTKQSLPNVTWFPATPAIADFNENGIPDLVADKSVVLDGVTVLNVETHPGQMRDVAAADINGDGHADAIFVMYNFDRAFNSVFEGFDVYFGDGRGGFTFGFGIGGMTGIQSIRVADLDRNGRLDVVGIGATPEGEAIYVVRQVAGQGWRMENAIPAGTFITDFELADVNRDGILDLLTAHYDPSTLDVRLGNGAGGFGAITEIALPSQGMPFRLGDFNHDGRLDIVMVSGQHAIMILATGDGTWAPPVQFADVNVFDSLDGLVIGDFNEDGHLDVFTSNGGLLAGNGDGTLAAVKGFAVNFSGAVAIDFNHDGLLDVVTAAEATLNERRTANRPPTANAGPDMTFTYRQQYEQDDGSLYGGESSDPDLHALSYEWRDETGKIFGFSVWANFPPKPPGTYAFTLTVRDGRGGESTDSINITITPYQEIVLHPGLGLVTVGNWQSVQDATAASGSRLFYPDGGAPKVTTPLANPTGYVDVGFTPDPTQTYKLWVRLKAQNNFFNNDSIWLQFSGAVDAAGQPAYGIDTTGGLPVNLEECSGCGISGWGWEDDGWGAVNRNGVLLRFPQGGPQRIRIQVREDGVSVDQIVLSAAKYLTTRPGAARNDTVILASTEQDQ